MSWQDGDALGIRLRIAPGATLSADPSTYPWIDVTGDVAWDMPITLTTGAADEASETNSQLSWTFRDNRGRYDVENAESDLYGLWDMGCPVEYALNLGDGSGWIVKAVQYVGSISDDYATAPHRVRRDIVAAGRFRGMGRAETVASTITRNMRSTKAVRYYRLEDGSDARQAVSDVANQPPMTQANGMLPAFSSRTGVPGSLAVPSFTSGTLLNVDFAAYKQTGSTVTWQWLMNVKTFTVANGYAVQRMIGGVATQWLVFQNPGACPQLRGFDGLGNIVYTSGSFTIQPGMVGDGANRPDSHPWWWIHVGLTQSGGNVLVDFRMTAQWIDGNGNGKNISYILAADTVAGQVGNVTGWTIGGGVEDVAIGHMGLFDSGVSSPLNSGSAAVVAWPQNAADRISGVSNEAKIPNSVTASPTAQLGPQQGGTVLSLLRDAALADHGILDDSRGVIGYRGLYDLYNLAPVLTLDGADRAIFLPFAPVRDDQKRKNRVTVSRPGGSSATVDNLTDETKAGLYADSPSLNLGSDADLANHANFGVTIGTVPGKRYPQVTIDLLRAPALARPWLGVKLGDRFQVVNPPRGGSKIGPQLQLRGTSETWHNRRTWTVVCNTVLADPWNVGSLEDPILGRAEADVNGVKVPTETTDPNASTLIVATTPDCPVLVDSLTYPADFPIDLNWEGEKITVTSLTPSTLDTFGRTVSNGLGTPDIGPAWTTSGGASSDYGVSGTRGTMALPSTGVERTASLANQGPDLDVTVYFVPTIVAAGAQFEQKLRLRHNGSTYYETNLQYQVNGTVTLYLSRGVSILSGIGNVLLYNSASIIGVRMQTIGSTIRQMIWDANVTAPPQGWSFATTDTGVPGNTTDAIMVVGNRIAGNSTSGLVVQFDNLSVPNPSVLTVTRSVNKIRKIHKAGSVLTLWQPMLLAL